MKIKGKDLIFISIIRRDGSGTDPVTKVSHLKETVFKVRCLSISMETYIAMEFNSFVVKLKKTNP